MKAHKSILYFLGTLILVLFWGCESNDNPLSSVYIQQPVNRKVLVEFFTNSGCTPCVVVHNYFQQLSSQSGVTINDSSVILISFHYRYPYPYDSLYLANVPENDARGTYYNILFTPNVLLDGTYMGQYSSSEYSAQLNNEMNTTKYMNITLSNSYDSTNRNGTITSNFQLVTSLPTADNVLHVVLTESNIAYMGTNGITSFDDVMRDMVTGGNGEQITLSQGQGNTVTKNYTINTRWNADECDLIVYVQSVSTKKIYGVEKIKVK
ncbi:MAG: Omp28-related outer membrane protein [Ignavibacteria bacterium]